MEMTIEQIAEAFSRHRFDDVYPYISDTIKWELVGEKQISGKKEVISTCNESAAYLSEVTTTFHKFKILVGENGVVIDSLAEYTDSEKSSTTIASCDIYNFVDGKLSEITSYTIALDIK